MFIERSSRALLCTDIVSALNFSVYRSATFIILNFSFLSNIVEESFLLCHHHVFLFFSSVLPERRPLKSTMPLPLFRSPSSRLNPKDIMEDDRGCAVDGLNLASSLEGSHNEAALHYSFMPNKQIVSLLPSHLGAASDSAAPSTALQLSRSVS